MGFLHLAANINSRPLHVDAAVVALERPDAIVLAVVVDYTRIDDIVVIVRIELELCMITCSYDFDRPRI